MSTEQASKQLFAMAYHATNDNMHDVTTQVLALVITELPKLKCQMLK